jgi:hypothetical protein
MDATLSDFPNIFAQWFAHARQKLNVNDGNSDSDDDGDGDEGHSHGDHRDAFGTKVSLATQDYATVISHDLCDWCWRLNLAGVYTYLEAHPTACFLSTDVTSALNRLSISSNEGVISIETNMDRLPASACAGCDILRFAAHVHLRNVCALKHKPRPRVLTLQVDSFGKLSFCTGVRQSYQQPLQMPGSAGVDYPATIGPEACKVPPVCSAMDRSIH